MTIMTITTERLHLRLLTEEDITPSYIEALNDPEVVSPTEVRYTTWDRERIRQWIRQSNADGISAVVGIFVRESGRHIGNVQLFNRHAVYRRAELSFIIFDKKERSRGYATEAVRAIVAYAFEVLGLHRIHADYYSVDTRLARVFHKAGFKVEGVYKEHLFCNGLWMDSIRVAKVNPGVGAPAERAPTDAAGRLPSAGPSITEREVQLVSEAARDGWYGNMSRYVDEFERRFSEYTGMPYCLATMSCTSAIHLAMLGLGIGPSDEVIVPDLTWVASAAPVCYAGARPVFVDVDPVTWCISADAFERAITKRTKAVVVVGLLGNLPDMDAIRTIAWRHRIPIIEDAAESLGAEYRGRKAGTFGAIGVFSFNGTKLVVTGEGGMVATRDKAVYKRCKGLAHHGMLMRGPRSKFYWAYELGYKYKMTNLQAALGLAQFSRIDELIAMRRRIFSWYAERLRGIDGLRLNQEGPHVRSTFWLVTAILDRRYGLRKEAVVKQFFERNIAGRPFFYPVSSMPPFARYCRGADMKRVNPVAYGLAPYGICLPSAAALTEADVDYVCEQLLDILSGRAVRRRASPRAPAVTVTGSRC